VQCVASFFFCLTPVRTKERVLGLSFSRVRVRAKLRVRVLGTVYGGYVGLSVDLWGGVGEAMD
jgi:ABC-type amino acid transport substrate-binding protein